eukprot:7822781-Lingulodinium_polyedra.AAC.1
MAASALAAPVVRRPRSPRARWRPPPAAGPAQFFGPPAREPPRPRLLRRQCRRASLHECGWRALSSRSPRF